ncbi:MAG: SPOR domain-containing protein [Candidatus Omnitrophica bacterium]|nr:SPOR domain-containing protein [Candidatus Omnitrophota bacterium]
MNVNFKEAQFEFFPNTGNTPDETKRPHFMAARFNLSIENLVIFSIVSIMVVIFAFSLGVERGKRIALRDAAPVAADTVSTEVSAVVPADPSAVKTSSVQAQVQAVKPVLSSKPVDKTLTVVQSKKIDPVSAAGVGSLQTGAVPSSGFTVQLASYKSEKSAKKEALTLQKKGLKAFVLPKGQHVILCVGNFQKKEDASVYGKKLKTNYQDFVVRRL